MSLSLLFYRLDGRLGELRSMCLPPVVLGRGLEMVVHWYLRLVGSFHLHPSIVRSGRLYLARLDKSEYIQRGRDQICEMEGSGSRPSPVSAHVCLQTMTNPVAANSELQPWAVRQVL